MSRIAVEKSFFGGYMLFLNNDYTQSKFKIISNQLISDQDYYITIRIEHTKKLYLISDQQYSF